MAVVFVLAIGLSSIVPALAVQQKRRGALSRAVARTQGSGGRLPMGRAYAFPVIAPMANALPPVYIEFATFARGKLWFSGSAPCVPTPSSGATHPGLVFGHGETSDTALKAGMVSVTKAGHFSQTINNVPTVVTGQGGSGPGTVSYAISGRFRPTAQTGVNKVNAHLSGTFTASSSAPDGTTCTTGVVHMRGPVYRVHAPPG